MDSRRLASLPTPRSSKVLLVEDEARIAQFVAKGLGRIGLDVTVAEDGDVGAFLAATEPSTWSCWTWVCRELRVWKFSA